VDKVANVYQHVYSADLRIHIVDARTAELAKYMENCFLATKVIFCNEFFDFAEKLGVSYTELRETWLMDERMGRSHTFVYPDKRGYDGKCLPKDMKAMLAQADALGVDATFLHAVDEKNAKYNG
jgi:UDPglucose 6-dehydrogenase